jgi:hypothetical protein
MSESITDRDDIKQPQDHLAPADERGDEVSAEAPHYPGAEQPNGGSSVSPATAAEPEKPARHGVDKLPPGIG